MSMVDLAETERRIAERVDPAAAGALELSQQAGGLGFSNMAEAMQFAKIMAISGFTVPKHLRGNVGACMAITIQAVEWKLSPFAVANKSYLVNDRLAYESQLIQAVVLQRAPIKGRFRVEFTGEGEKRRCTVTATLKEGGEKDYTSPEIGKIPVKNSPLWKNDPDQQLFYYSGRALCRRHFPDVLLGIYTPEELYDAAEPRRGPEHARDVTPKKTLTEKLDAPAANGNGDPPHDPETGEIIGASTSEFGVGKGPDAPNADWKPEDDPTGGKAGQLLKEQLDERALQNQQTMGGETRDVMPGTTANVGLGASPIDSRIQQLLDEGRAAATNGVAAFDKWWKRLGAPDAARITKEHHAAMRKAAAEADGRGA